ncbi:flagellar hook protein [Methylobacterium currus]|uniref:Flagellin n=1 Tax=Methylobacterium currus TaxID=2051553 RepID=A0A2R4WWI8_9HYPH|nr:flagellin [Methylobacterium currus]AWB25896.1 flagellar hook protein [Methylobacterium currus]
MSSGITLSAATRQNLLSLQGTADMLSTTQTRLSSGKKVNSALDNPSNYFTAQGLSSRSSSLSGLLDAVSNGIQTIQAANTGITKLQGLTDQLKSVAQQAISASNSFVAKAAISSTALTGATADNLLSTGATSVLADTALSTNTSGVAANKTGNVDVSTQTAIQTALFTAGATSLTMSIDGVSITLNKNVDDTSQSTLVSSINSQLKAGGSNVQAAISGNFIKLAGSTDGATFSVDSTANTKLGFGITANAAGQFLVNGTFSPTATTLATAIGFTAGDSFTVNGQSVMVSKSDTLSSLAQKVGTATGGTVSASFDSTTRKFTFTAADASTAINLGDGSTATAKVTNLGFTAFKSYAAGQGATTIQQYTTPPALVGVNYQSFNASALANSSIAVKVANGTTVNVAFGTGSGQISSLTQLNAALAPANAMASLDSSTGQLKITTTNESGADALQLTATGTLNPFSSGTSTAIIAGDGANTRNGLVNTYNNLLTQIDQMALDSGFNGTNLLAGDTLNIAFNEKGTSSLKIQGSSVTSSSIGLSAIGQVDFQDTNSINDVMKKITSASNSLKNQASSLGANLAVVQNRQDFTKQMINVLDTGAANLTNADLNEEAANSQALSTRNSLGISALSLANQAQQGILQLLR